MDMNRMAHEMLCIINLFLSCITILRIHPETERHKSIIEQRTGVSILITKRPALSARRVTDESIILLTICREGLVPCKKYPGILYAQRKT